MHRSAFFTEVSPAMLVQRDKSKPERRYTTVPIRLHANARGAAISGRSTLVGYAALFDTETVIAGMFRERIAKGAFADAIHNNADVIAVFNHDVNYVLGRTANKTVRLAEDATGLRYEVDLNPEDPEAMRVGAIVRRGDVRGSSFQFSIEDDADDEWDMSQTKQGKLPLRTLKRMQLWDVSPVTRPAYAETTVEFDGKRRNGETPIDVLERELDLLELEDAAQPSIVTPRYVGPLAPYFAELDRLESDR